MLKLRVMNIRNKKHIFIFLIAIIIGLFAFLIFSKSYTKIYEIHNNYGFTEEDVQKILENKNIKDAYGSYEIELLNNKIVKSINEKEFILTSGRLPERAGEIVIEADDEYELGNNYTIGDSSFKIVGFYKAKLQSNVSGYCLADNFDNSSYDSITIYVSSILNPESVLKKVQKELSEKRKEEVILIKEKQIEELKDKHDVLEENIEIYSEEVDSKFASAEEKINTSSKLVNDYQSKINSAKKELDAGKDKLNKAKEKLDNANKDLIDFRKQIDSAIAELNNRLSQYGINYKDLNSFYNQAEQELIKRGYTIEFVEENLETIENIDYYIDMLNNAIDRGIEKLIQMDQAPEEELANIRESFENDWDEITYAYNKLKAFLVDTVLDKTVDSLTSIKEALVKLQDNIAEIEQLIDIKNNIDEIRTALSAKRQIDNAEIEYSVYYEQYENGLIDYQKGLEEYNQKLKKYNSYVNQLEDYKKQLNANKEKLTNEKNKFNSGIAEYNNDLDGTAKNIEDLKEEIKDINIEWDYSNSIKTSFNILPTVIYVALLCGIIFAIKKERII